MIELLGSVRYVVWRRPINPLDVLLLTFQTDQIVLLYFCFDQSSHSLLHYLLSSKDYKKQLLLQSLLLISLTMSLLDLWLWIEEKPLGPPSYHSLAMMLSAHWFLLCLLLRISLVLKPLLSTIGGSLWPILFLSSWMYLHKVVLKVLI